MIYENEHLIPGILGNFFIVLSFVSALLATVSYALHTFKPIDSNWKLIARWSFIIHIVSAIAIGICLFYILLNGYFEYHYAFQHSSKELPLRYVLSCFWEGQEGSTWLWMFWQAILGIVLLRILKQWESPVLAVVSSVQLFLACMLLGVVVFDYQTGSNPFTLLRLHKDMMDMPFVKSASYLESINGRGLNPLLQNYWMTIHPPTLFLGFASTLVPFAYGIAGLLTKQYTQWVKPVMPWVVFSVMILGTGILMGGAWAYESLSFGGFWAWDPVENASLVPWIIMVAALHVLLIYRHNNGSIFSSFLFVILSFLLIVYSTFLTKSGILGNSSVHAFTDMGMSGLLLVFLFFYIILSCYLLVINYKTLPSNVQEDELWSREFWIFIGALILAIAGFQIIFSTSLPVINKIFNTNYAPPVDIIGYYNAWQIPFTIIIVLLMAVTQFFKWRTSSIREITKRLTKSALIALVLTIICCATLRIDKVALVLLFFVSTWSVLSNADYWFRALKFKTAKAGASIAHMGFALIMLGTLISQYKQQVISKNVGSTDISKLQEGIKNNENVMLVKGDTTVLGNYYVVYNNKRKQGVNIFYDMDYLQRNPDGSYYKLFTLSPLVQMNERMGNIAEPDTRHFLTKDIYTHVSFVDLSHEQETNHDDHFKETEQKNLIAGDTIFASNAILVLEGLIKDIDKTKLNLKPTDIALAARFVVYDMNKQSYIAQPIFVVRDNFLVPVEAEVKPLGLSITFKELNTSTGAIDVVIKEKEGQQKDYIVMKAIVFPGINILWIGAIIMIIGSCIAIINRIKLLKSGV